MFQAKKNVPKNFVPFVPFPKNGISVGTVPKKMFQLFKNVPKMFQFSVFDFQLVNKFLEQMEQLQKKCSKVTV